MSDPNGDAPAGRFIGDRIEVALSDEPAPEKRPRCPAAFTWRGERRAIVECLNEWVDFSRRGRMARNMRPDHQAAAESRGSWGVGRHYFRVRADDGRLFVIYYDRAPRGRKDRKGAWYLFSEARAEGTPGRDAAPEDRG